MTCAAVVRFFVVGCALCSISARRMTLDEKTLSFLELDESEFQNASSSNDTNTSIGDVDTKVVPFKAAVIDHLGLAVTQGQDKSSPHMATLSRGTMVNVLKVEEPDAEGLVRAQIENPAGWVDAWLKDYREQFIVKADYFREFRRCPDEAFKAPNPHMSNWTSWQTGIPSGSKVKFLVSDDRRNVFEKGYKHEREGQTATVVDGDLRVHVGTGIQTGAKDACWFDGELMFDGFDWGFGFRNVAVKLLMKASDLNDHPQFVGLGAALSPADKQAILSPLVSKVRGRYTPKQEVLTAALKDETLDPIVIPIVEKLVAASAPDTKVIDAPEQMQLPSTANLGIIPDMPLMEETLLSAVVRSSVDESRKVLRPVRASTPEEKVIACTVIGRIKRPVCCIEACEGDNECVKDCMTRPAQS